MRDYLGSTRAVFDITPDYAEDLSEVILEQNDYCLFGSRIDNADLPTLAQNRYRFNGKEKLVAGANDTGLTDYGARMFSAPLARWTTPDPLADKYYSISPYAFCNNNPVNLVDPDGKAIETAWDIASIGLGIGSLVKNIKDGNIKGAIGDGLGIAADVVAAAVPFLPGGVGALRAGAKVVDAVDDVADAVKAVNTADNAVTAAKGADAISPTARGRINEAKALDEFGLTKNTKTVQGTTLAGETRNTIPDSITSDTVYEVKDVKTLSNTKQIQAQMNYAKEKGLNYRIITGTKTHVSKNIPEEYIMRLDYLGPQK